LKKTMVEYALSNGCENDTGIVMNDGNV